jgi:hypothetical protein
VWALLREGCAAPTSAAISRWPDCAIAVWMVDGEATVFNQGKPIHAPYLMSDGDPRLLQFRFATRDAAKSSGIEFGPPTPPSMSMSSEPSEPASDGPDDSDKSAEPAAPAPPFYGYWSFRPEGPVPYRRGKAWQIQCPDREMPGLAKSDDGCVASTLEGVRSIAGPPGQAELVLDAVWVADAR